MNKRELIFPDYKKWVKALLVISCLAVIPIFFWMGFYYRDYYDKRHDVIITDIENVLVKDVKPKQKAEGVVTVK